jgi:uncharacterized membrane protein
MQTIYDFFLQFSAPTATFLMAMFPLTELRASVPVAIGVFKMAPVWAALISIAGNIVPAIFLVYFLPPLAQFLSARSDLAKRFFDWWFGRVIKQFQEKYQKYGEWGLMVFVAIPLPMTGAWTGAVASFLFNIPPRRGLVFVGLGVIIAGIIVTLLAAGIFR